MSRCGKEPVIIGSHYLLYQHIFTVAQVLAGNSDYRFIGGRRCWGARYEAGTQATQDAESYEQYELSVAQADHSRST
jgi:hypothetical protein